MTGPGRRRDALVIGLLALLPILAHAPAWLENRLIGPGDGAALHYPLKVAVWRALRHQSIPAWNPWIFTGTPLLASYRPGAFFPPTMLAAALPDFAAFQVLVLFSLSASAVLLYIYLRRLGAGRVGAYLSGLSFSLGPYLVAHLGDTATVIAAPTLPLMLLAAEAYVRRGSAGRAAGLAAAVALVLLAGSPEAARAGGALVAGRLLVAHFFPAGGRAPSRRATVLALAAGVLLAAPQLLPTLLLARDAGPSTTGLAAATGGVLPGATGLVLRYVSHTPAPALALAALPLVLTETPIRVLGVALTLCLALQWGRGPLSAPGAASLVFDLTLAIAAGLSLSAQWEARQEALGKRLRAYFLFSCLAAAAALSVSAAALGPLQQPLSGAVGILALALILYFSLAASPNAVRAGVFLLPLTVAFLLQPQGRRAWDGAPTRAELRQGTATRQAIDGAMGLRHGERVLTLARSWPRDEALDLAYANLGSLSLRRSANGYDPMVALRTRRAFDEMSSGGTLPGAFFRSDPGRLEAFAIRWVQAPTAALTGNGDGYGLGDTLDMVLEPGRPRFFPLPISTATELHLASLMSDAVNVRQDTPVARVLVRLASGRDLEMVVRAGQDTGEWAHDRPDVKKSVAHERPRILESWRDPSGLFEGHVYDGILRLPGRYSVDGVRIERLPGPGRLTLSRMALRDEVSGHATPVSLVAGFVSDQDRFREAAATPAVRLFELPRSLGLAHVVPALRPLPDDPAVLRRLRLGTAFDPRLEALAVATDAEGVTIRAGGQPSRADVKRAQPGRIEIRASGPGLLVVAEGWDRGWTASVDGRAAPIVRVNQIQMGIPLPAGFPAIVLRYQARGLWLGLMLAASAALGLAVAVLRERGRG